MTTMWNEFSMAKLKNKEISESDVLEYVEEQSDFAFELRVHRQLLACGFECEHGGTYEDPITSKIRQFDQQA